MGQIMELKQRLGHLCTWQRVNEHMLAPVETARLVYYFTSVEQEQKSNK